MANLLNKLRMLEAEPKRPASSCDAPVHREGCYHNQVLYPLSIFSDIRHASPAVLESAFGFSFPKRVVPEDILFLDIKYLALGGIKKNDWNPPPR